MTQPQPPQIDIFRDVVGDKVFADAEPSAVIAISQQVVDAVGLTPPLNESIPADFSPQTEYLAISYLNPELDRPDYYDSRATLLSATVTQQDEISTIGLYGELLGDAVESLESAAGASIQALPRMLSMGYEQPEQTTSAAETLGAIDVEGALEVKARFGAFSGMLQTLVHLGDYVENTRGSDIIHAYLSENANYIPAIHEAVQDVINSIEDPSNDRMLRNRLSHIALDAYMRSTDPTVHRSMVENVSRTLQAVYARPELRTLRFAYPHAYDFGPVAFRPPMSQNRLIAPVTLERGPIDPRIAIKANIEVDGTYDFRTHTFTTAERGNGRSKIAFQIERKHTSPEQTERALGDVLDAQIHDITSGQLNQETLDNYKLSKREIGRLALKSWHTMPANVKVRRNPLETLRK